MKRNEFIFISIFAIFLNPIKLLDAIMKKVDRKKKKLIFTWQDKNGIVHKKMVEKA